MSLSLAATRLTAGGAVAVATVVASADPAWAHHPPEEAGSAGLMAGAMDAAAEEAGSAGLPTWLIVAAMVAVAGGLLARTGLALPRRSRRRISLVVAAIALVGSGLGGVSGASAATLLLPDLISDQPDPVGGVQTNSYTGEERLVLRFDGYVTNVGVGPLEVSGNPLNTDPLDPDAVHQRAIDTDGVWQVVGTPTVQFETADSHNHFHLMEVARYSLWNLDRTGEVAPGQKVGFCLYDIEPAEAEDFSGMRDPLTYTQPVTQFCDANNPTSTDLVMGTGAGWRDVYTAQVTFQWVDVSATPPGVYWLASEADPHNRVRESNEDNNQVAFAEVTSIVPGYNALPVGPLEAGPGPLGVQLATESFGAPGARVFEIVEAPDHGVLDIAVGVAFAPAALNYTPDPGYEGCDSFEYVARDSTSNYPFYPTRATVSIDVGDAGCPAVAISGAPTSLIAGTSVDLTPSLDDADPGVTWSVDGIIGGSDTVGTISTSGLYTAPSIVPDDGYVTIRATLEADSSVYDEIEIVIDPVPNEAPFMVDPGNQTSIVGHNVTLVVETSDPDGDPFGFTATGLPAGLAIHPATGVVTGTPAGPGVHAVTVTADDGKSHSVVEFDWLVAPDFVDVDPSSWYGPSVMWLAGTEITTGTTPTTFSPDRDVTRGEAVTLLWRWVGRPAAPPSSFADVDPGAYYAAAVAWAEAAGVVTGTSPTTFAPEATMNRAQLATVFHRLAGSPDSPYPPPFADVESDRYYTLPVAWMAEQGLTTGIAPGVYDPHGLVTRAQFSTVLCRYSASLAATDPAAIRGAAICDLA